MRKAPVVNRKKPSRRRRSRSTADGAFLRGLRVLLEKHLAGLSPEGQHRQLVAAERLLAERKDTLPADNRKQLEWLRRWAQTPDEAGPEFWDEFERDLRKHRLQI